MGISQILPIKDEFEPHFQELPEDRTPFEFYPIFRDQVTVTHGLFRMIKVKFGGLPAETDAFYNQWSNRKQFPHQFLIHKIYRSKFSVIMYLDYPDIIVNQLNELELLECMDTCFQVLAGWQTLQIYHGFFGRQSVFQSIGCSGIKVFKILDRELFPRHKKPFKKCLEMKQVEQLKILLSKYYLSPALFEALGMKNHHPKNNCYKSDDHDFYDFDTFEIKLDKIRANIISKNFRKYHQQMLLSMLIYEQDDRPDFLQLNATFNRYAYPLYYTRVECKFQDLLYNPSKAQNNQLLISKHLEKSQLLSSRIQQKHQLDLQVQSQFVKDQTQSQINIPQQEQQQIKSQIYPSQMIQSQQPSQIIQSRYVPEQSKIQLQDQPQLRQAQSIYQQAYANEEFSIIEQQMEEEQALLASNVDPNMSFQGLDFTLQSLTPLPNVPTHQKQQNFKRDLILNNNKQKPNQILQQGRLEVLKIELQHSGHHDLSRWQSAQGKTINGKLEGQAAVKFGNGDYFEGIFKADKANGRGIYTYKNGYEVEGYWIDNHFQLMI
ncbi:hypothetical protein pb186bvf_003491 [Paramecium bursaria]